MLDDDACQQALGAEQNLVVETRACAAPFTDATPGTSDPSLCYPFGVIGCP